MAAAKLKLRGRQGETFRRRLDLFADAARTQPLDLSAWGARMQVRVDYADDDPGDPILDLTETETADGRIWIDWSDGATPARNRIWIYVGAERMSAVDDDVFVYDLEIVSLTDPDEVDALLEGPFIVAPEVTR